QHLRDFSGEERLMGSERRDCTDQIARRVRLQKITARSRCNSLAHHFLRFVHRKYQYFDSRYRCPDLPRRLKSIQLRHGEVEDRDIRNKLLRHCNGCPASRSLATNLPAGMVLEQNTQASTNDVMIVRNENAQHVEPPP